MGYKSESQASNHSFELPDEDQDILVDSTQF